MTTGNKGKQLEVNGQYQIHIEQRLNVSRPNLIEIITKAVMKQHSYNSVCLCVCFTKTLLQVPISMLEARGPMGLRKDLHIKAITEIPEIKERWKQVHGKYPDQGKIMFIEIWSYL